MRKLGFFLIAAIALMAMVTVACGGGEEASPTPTEAPGATGTSQASPTSQATATQPSGPIPTFAPGEVDPVSYSDLMDFLPGAPSGWEADDPSGGTYQMQDFWWSQASNDYTNMSTDEYVDIGIFDSAYYRGFGWWAAWDYAFSYESSEGYARSTTYQGYPAWEIYDKPDSYSLSVLVADRFMVVVSSETKASLDLFAGLVDYGGIAALS